MVDWGKDKMGSIYVAIDMDRIGFVEFNASAKTRESH